MDNSLYAPIADCRADAARADGGTDAQGCRVADLRALSFAQWVDDYRGQPEFVRKPFSNCIGRQV